MNIEYILNVHIQYSMYIQCFAIYPIISLLVGDRQTDSHTQILEMLLHLKTSFISPESYNTV